MARKTNKTKKQAEAATPETEDTAVVAEALDVTEDAPEVDVAETEGEGDAPSTPDEEPVEDTVEPEAAEMVDTAPAKEPAPARKGGFMPTVLGGVVAAGIGFGTALYLLPNLPASLLPDQGEDMSAVLAEKLEAQSAEIEALKAQLTAAGDKTALETALSDVARQVAGVASDVATLKDAQGDISDFETRLSTLEKAPLASASPAAVEAYQREMAQLQEALAAQRADVEAMAAEAEEKRASAEMTAQEALQRSAVSQILTSLETGSSFGDAVASLQATGAEVPEALVAQAGGVPSVAQLTADFPEAAREALAAARTSDTESGGGFGAFLKTQLGARSLEPREGSDPDAVLSRMEAAARDGRLGDVMAEAEALPEAAQAPLQDWLDAAKARQAAVDAANVLSQQINTK